MGTDFSVPATHEHLDPTRYEQELDVGDLVLFSGKHSFFSTAIRTLSTPIPWTHVGVVVRWPRSDGPLYLLQSTYGKTPHNHHAGADRIKTGPKMTPLKEALDSYDGYMKAIRKLVYPGRQMASQKSQFQLNFQHYFFVCLEQFLNKHLVKPYEQNYVELLGAAYSANQRANTDSLFCSELVAELLIDLGLLPVNWMPSNNYNMFHVCSVTVLPIRFPFQYSEELYIQHPMQYYIIND